ncbi:hypothetical protein NPIL_492691 [Nephila pilipes]|uniref:Uncharacterized protein n=1 Tax=Nephila pilipes TaxID=299642 RepID=A0A8X6NDF6_NEPPI|nr:hypothetical protein NPIL_492691 [Nephila pilipes]
MCTFDFSRLNTAYLILGMLRKHGLITKEAASLFQNLPSDCGDLQVESSSDEELSIDNPLVASLSDFQNAKNVNSSSNEDIVEQSFPRLRKMRKYCNIYSNFFH